MPHNRRSLEVTQAYRRRIAQIGERVSQRAKEGFPALGELDSSRWTERTTILVTQAQLEGVRAASGYLAAFYFSETGRRITPPALGRETVGLSRDGRPLKEALRSPLVGVKAALKDGKTSEEAIRAGLARATRMTSFEAVQASRDALLGAIEADDRFTGWQRATAGTCGACLELSGSGGPRFEVHPGCECQPAPVIKGLADRFPVPSGAALFASKTKEEQDAALGPETADKVRGGEVALGDLVEHNHLATDQPNFITQKPLDRVV